ncbi:MAG: site-specific integrase [Gammaproteobacteria bacterium]|nr:site-specific integrase [Gammaproteobacteria bacterium]
MISNRQKQTIHEDICQLRYLKPYFEGQALEAIHMGSLQPFIADRLQTGVKHRTVNSALKVVRHLLNQASSEWLDEQGQPWLTRVPKIKLLSEHDARKPRPISWEEQDRLFAELPPLLHDMSIFAVNTGCRDQEICQLQWQWEISIPESEQSLFVLPGWYRNADNALVKFTKTGKDRLVVLNSIAQKIVDQQRHNGSVYVFTYTDHQGRCRPRDRMNNRSWRSARMRAGLDDVRVHDLRHTFGRRLRAAGVSFEDRQDLLGHCSGRMTTHYSPAEVKQLQLAVNRLCDRQISTPIAAAMTAVNALQTNNFSQKVTQNSRKGSDGHDGK